MKIDAAFSVCSALVAGAFLAGCSCIKHVPPGQSLSAAMAKKAQLVSLPAPPPGPAVASKPSQPADEAAALPRTEKVADAFTLGNLCLQQGRYPEAIAAYETALKADPSFAEAWNNLAIAYQDLGQDDKAMAAFRKYKMVALH
jgi:tetratricopeptide (TPR) repeat protein